VVAMFNDEAGAQHAPVAAQMGSLDRRGSPPSSSGPARSRARCAIDWSPRLRHDHRGGPAADLDAPLRLTTRHPRDRHPAEAELPAAARQVHAPPQRSHDTQFVYNTRAISTGSGTLFVHGSFFTPLPDALESCFFFPIVMRRRGGEGGSGGVAGVGNFRDDAGRFLKTGRAGVTMPLMTAPIDGESCGADAKATAAEVMRSKHASRSLPSGSVRESSRHSARPRNVRRDASKIQICVAFVFCERFGHYALSR
jgi:hypothetical protein